MVGEYKKAGVDIGAAAGLVRDIKELLQDADKRGVVSGIGGFCSIFDPGAIYPDYRGPLIAQSTDGVGTKLQVAQIISPPYLWTCGVDIVNHCINDILCCGATPATFLDYIAQDKLRPDEVLGILRGMKDACGTADISLVGGETAQMKGTYRRGEADVVGFITGFVERNELIDGTRIRSGDQLIGFPSNGLHTNGYSLVRKIFSKEGKYWPYFYYKEIGKQLVGAFLLPHTSYLEHIKFLRKSGILIRGIAHITGGGIAGNLSRILPDNVRAKVDKNSWRVPSIFSLIQKEGKISEEEMFRVFNMGIGMIIAVPHSQGIIAKYFLEKAGYTAYEIGCIADGGSGAVGIE